MPNIEMYSTRFCPYCMAARRLLDAKQVEYTVYDLDREPARRKEMMERSGRHTVPQI
ncbi:MAG: glutathione S-transferase N-terminal domain-containing protein, partial [Gammaproteobacteria bacterium]|nr:glutathione S-transferase N-terminal domain-containing protein [Gammaproteobacteria bacterium]